MKTQKKKNSKGFTLIEMMIAVSIFLIVVMIGMAALLNAGAVHNNSKNMRSIMDSLSFMMDDMSRNIRLGYNYQCLITGNQYSDDTALNIPKSCSNGFGIAFESSDGVVSNNSDQWIYYFSDNKVYKSISGISSGGLIQLNPDEVKIDSSESGFSILGAESTANGDNQQPLVVIRLVGSIIYQGKETPFSIQTSVSQRINDF